MVLAQLVFNLKFYLFSYISTYSNLILFKISNSIKLYLNHILLESVWYLEKQSYFVFFNSLDTTSQAISPPIQFVFTLSINVKSSSEVNFLNSSCEMSFSAAALIYIALSVLWIICSIPNQSILPNLKFVLTNCIRSSISSTVHAFCTIADGIA